MRDLAIENLFLSFNLSCFLSVYFNFGGQMVDKKIKKLPIQRPGALKKEKLMWRGFCILKVRGMCVREYLYPCGVGFKQ